MSPAEAAQIVRLLEGQGFRVRVRSLSPLELVLTIPESGGQSCPQG